MICSKCNSKVGVTGTLVSEDGVKVRRYKCKNCGSVYYAKEKEQVIHNDPEAKIIYNRTLYKKVLANLSKGAD